VKDRRQGGFLLSKIHRLSGRVFSNLLREEGIEISPAQGRVLFALWSEDRIPMGNLARRAALGKSALTSMLDGLESMGLVERIPDARDRRMTRVARTDKDRSLEADYRRVSGRMTELFYRGFTDVEVTRFERDLLQIVENLERAGGSPDRRMP
jgi:MarR family transcriptional regulator, organic hydroperoxide resistance regulator